MPSGFRSERIFVGKEPKTRRVAVQSTRKCSGLGQKLIKNFSMEILERRKFCSFG